MKNFVVSVKVIMINNTSYDIFVKARVEETPDVETVRNLIMSEPFIVVHNLCTVETKFVSQIIIVDYKEEKPKK